MGVHVQEPSVITIPAERLATTATLSLDHAFGVLALPDAATTRATALLELPQTWTTFDLAAILLNVSGTAVNDVVLSAHTLPTESDTQDLTADSYAGAATVTYTVTDATGDLLEVATLDSGLAVATRQRLYVERLGSDGADTFAGAIHLVALLLTKAS